MINTIIWYNSFTMCTFQVPFSEVGEGTYIVFKLVWDPFWKVSGLVFYDFFQTRNLNTYTVIRNLKKDVFSTYKYSSLINILKISLSIRKTCFLHPFKSPNLQKEIRSLKKNIHSSYKICNSRLIYFKNYKKNRFFPSWISPTSRTK